MKAFAEDREKLKELILYVSEKCEGDPHFGATKLNKILFFADFLAYARWGRPVTGAEYMREKFGPVPRRLVPARQELLDAGALAIQQTRWSERAVSQRPVSLRPADLASFSGDEIALIDSIIEGLRPATACGVSELTHQFPLWLVAQDRETIPYEAAFVGNDALTAAEIERGRELAAEYGWA
jgi:hypothetical protein